MDCPVLRIYKNNVIGKLSDERYSTMSQCYEEKQKQLKEQPADIKREIEQQEQQSQNLEQPIERVKRNTELTELTPSPYAAHELFQKIYVEAPDKSSGKRR